KDIPKGDVVRVVFDCTTPGTFLRKEDFSCAVTGTSDPDGNPILGDNTCSVSVDVPQEPLGGHAGESSETASERGTRSGIQSDSVTVAHKEGWRWSKGLLRRVVAG